MFGQTIETIGETVDFVGVLVIVLGIVLATLRYLRKGRAEENRYHMYSLEIGRALLLGLEFLVAADIIRTVAVRPTFENLGILAGIVLIRTFLSWTLEVEIEGRWPWQSQGRREKSM